VVRRGGTNTYEKTEVDAVTLIGTSADQRWLYWLVVDGKQPGYSEGLSAGEASDLMGELGVSDAIRMDGGASTTLAVSGSWLGGSILNRPRNWLYPGLPHPVGNVLGVRRRPR
jgi:exopolysaccharide biosynthesis protein